MTGQYSDKYSNHEEIDITKSIIGRLTKEGISLTYNNQPIGKILWENILDIDLNHYNFSFKDGKIFIFKAYPLISQYAENCDLGWC